MKILFAFFLRIYVITRLLSNSGLFIDFLEYRVLFLFSNREGGGKREETRTKVKIRLRWESLASV